MAIFRADIQTIERLLTTGLRQSAPLIDAEFTETINSPEFEWPGTTHRRNGETVGTPRNIVDTGEFRDSQRYQFVDPFSIEWQWPVEYALYIYAGFTTRSGSEYPGREWTDETLRRVDLAELYASQVRRLL